jgi:uncharacterized Zn finger protein (UPF0148 family)
MKVCEVCGVEFGGRDGENVCPTCEREAHSKAKRARARANRKVREAALESCGLVKVRGALGGTYWE